MGMADVVAAGQETVPCNLCGDSGFPDPRFSKLLELPPEFAARHCPGCSLRWLSPRPSAEAYRLLYSAENYFESGDITDYSQYARQREQYFKARIATIALAHPPPARILDYGSATGEFVEFAREAGFVAEGVEFSEDARRTAASRGIDLMAPEDVPQAAFDVIHMNHVLEHMPDPLSHLRMCQGLLAPQGTLVVEVPNQFDNDLDRLRRWSGKADAQPFNSFSLHHTFFFTKRSLGALAQAAGFTIHTLKTLVAEPPGQIGLMRKLVQFAATVAAARGNGGDVIELYARKP